MKIIKVILCYYYFLQIAELVENVEEVGTFAENLASGSKTVMRQVDSRRLDLTDPSLAAILEDEVKKVLEEKANHARSSALKYTSPQTIQSVIHAKQTLCLHNCALELLIMAVQNFEQSYNNHLNYSTFANCTYANKNLFIITSVIHTVVMSVNM